MDKEKLLKLMERAGLGRMSSSGGYWIPNYSTIDRIERLIAIVLSAAQEEREQDAWFPLTDEDREQVFHSMPGGLDGFLKAWGWLPFSKAIEEKCREKNAFVRSLKRPLQAQEPSASGAVDSQPSTVTDEWIDSIAEKETGFEAADGVQPMSPDGIRRIVRTAISRAQAAQQAQPVSDKLAWRCGFDAGCIATEARFSQSAAPASEQPEGSEGNRLYRWLEQAAKSDSADVAHAARTMMAYYQGAEFPEQPTAFPERDPSKPAEQQGMFRKFDVRRVDGSDAPGGKHYGCRYFVLDLNHDQYAPAAMRAYAAACRSTHPQLSAEIEAEFGEQPAAQAFRKHLDQCSKEVADWPDWKKQPAAQAAVPDKILAEALKIADEVQAVKYYRSAKGCTLREAINTIRAARAAAQSPQGGDK